MAGVGRRYDPVENRMASDAGDALPRASSDRLPDTPTDADLPQHGIELNALLRVAFLAGAEERSRNDHGRGLTDEELGSSCPSTRATSPTTLATERD